MTFLYITCYCVAFNRKLLVFMQMEKGKHNKGGYSSISGPQVIEKSFNDMSISCTGFGSGSGLGGLNTDTDTFTSRPKGIIFWSILTNTTCSISRNAYCVHSYCLVTILFIYIFSSSILSWFFLYISEMIPSVLKDQMVWTWFMSMFNTSNIKILSIFRFDA